MRSRIAIIAVCLLVAGCNAPTRLSSPVLTPAQAATSPLPVTPPPTLTPTAKPTPDTLAIPGLTNADIKLNLQDRDFACGGPDLAGAIATWTCSRISGLADLTVRYRGPDPTIVYSVDAQTIGADDRLAADFLGFIATLPYAGADPERARSWVQDRIGTSASTTIGHARFTLGGPENARYLTIDPP